MSVTDASELVAKSNPKQRSEAERKVKNILNKCKKLNLKTCEVASIFKTHIDKYKKPSNHTFKHKISLSFVVLFIAVAFYFYMDLRESDRCWIELPQFMVKATRPPEPCSMCDSVREVVRVANLTPHTFEKEFAYNARPVIVTDAAVNWTATQVFSFEFFKQIYLDTDLGRASRNCQFFPYKTEFKSLQDALEMDEDRANLTEGTKPWYIGWSNCHDKVAKILRKYYGKPYFLPDTAENNPIDWIFMGGPGFGAQMHVDNVVHPSWQAQLRGRKKWQLAPPPECLYSCSFIDTVVNPGEIIVLDTNRWYHKTEVLPGDISITIGAEYD